MYQIMLAPLAPHRHAVRPSQPRLLALVEDGAAAASPVVVAAGDHLLHEGVEIVLGRHGADGKRRGET
jgi:hypothetical protein